MDGYKKCINGNALINMHRNERLNNTLHRK